mgnify:CR=1 FL=1
MINLRTKGITNYLNEEFVEFVQLEIKDMKYNLALFLDRKILFMFSPSEFCYILK